MRKTAICGERVRAFLCWMVLAACALSLAPSAAHGQERGQENGSAAQARLLFERGFYAEHHEHDLDRALEHYLLAAEMAERFDDGATAQRAREAHRLVLVRLGRLEPMAGSADEPAMAGRNELRELLERLRDAPGPVEQSRALALLEAGELPPEEAAAVQRALDRFLIENVEGEGASAAIVRRFAELDPELQVLALERVARELYEPGIPLLGAAMRRGAPEVREAARRAFAAFQEHERFTERFEAWKRSYKRGTAPPKAVRRLLGRLGSRDPEEVRRAAAALGEMGDPAALPALVRLLETDDPALRRTIGEALLTIVEKE